MFQWCLSALNLPHAQHVHELKPVKTVTAEEAKSLDVPKLGVLRLDYNYPPAPGDIDHPDSFSYPVIYKVIPGLTFEICQSGVVSKQVEKDILMSVEYLEKHNVKGIVGDCGFMLFFQRLVRNHTRLPVCLSPLSLVPSVDTFFGLSRCSGACLLIILTANASSLETLHPLMKRECSVDPTDTSHMIVGCEDLPGFEAVALGTEVNTVVVQEHVVKRCKQLVAERPEIAGFLFECTELPHYADAVREATGLPVWDAISAANHLMNAHMDNPNFGNTAWYDDTRVKVAYKFGEELSADEKLRLVSKSEDAKTHSPVDVLAHRHPPVVPH
mmetsp:Transcript_34702/g.68529  ORF Transcript_34702/g.68529 Transcript_34702/m.68529 type:complete len:328 (-) Transcript_34702:323-1306(-)